MTAPHQETGIIPAILPRLQPTTEIQSRSSAQIPLLSTLTATIDMDVALKYETDVDALIKKLEAKTPDGSKPVSENTNEETLELFNYP